MYSCSFTCHCMALIFSFMDVFHWNIINHLCVFTLSFLFHSHDIKSSKYTLQGIRRYLTDAKQIGNKWGTNKKQMKTILSISFFTKYKQLIMFIFLQSDCIVSHNLQSSKTYIIKSVLLSTHPKVPRILV